MRDFSIEDTFGRRTQFVGEHIVADSTNADNKPQWMDIDVWRTESGNFVVRRSTRYRVRHQLESCPRLTGMESRTPVAADSYPCNVCNKDGILVGGWTQLDRTAVDAYCSPALLVDSFKINDRFSGLSRSLLADISEQDARVDDLWNVVRVP